MKSILITGATGFIGAAIVEKLVDLGFTNVWCLCRDELKKEHLCTEVDPSCLSFLDGDVSRTDLLREGVAGASVVVCAAGRAAVAVRADSRGAVLDGHDAEFLDGAARDAGEARPDVDVLHV